MSSSPISPCPSCPPHAAGGHGCAVYSSSVTDAEWAILEPPRPAVLPGRPRRTTREALPPCDSGRHPVHRARWYRVAATAGGVPASWDGVRGLRPLGPAAWQRILDALRDRLRVRAGRDRCPTAAIIDSQTVPAADTVPRSSRGWDGAKKTNGVYLELMNGVWL